MITIYYQQVWFEGNEHEIKFSSTSLDDLSELPGMQLLEVDDLERHNVPSRTWEFCEQQMDPGLAETTEEKYRW